VHCGAGIIRPRRALWINSFQPKYSAHGNFSTFKTTDFFNTIGRLRLRMDNLAHASRADNRAPATESPSSRRYVVALASAAKATSPRRRNDDGSVHLRAPHHRRDRPCRVGRELRIVFPSRADRCRLGMSRHWRLLRSAQNGGLLFRCPGCECADRVKPAVRVEMPAPPRELNKLP